MVAAHRFLAPWYVVPADDKEARNLIVASILLKALREMDPQYPKLPDDLARLEVIWISAALPQSG